MVAVDVVLCFLSPVGVERAATWTWDLDVRCIAGRFGEDSLELLHHWEGLCWSWRLRLAALGVRASTVSSHLSARRSNLSFWT